jgi:hypothetical protein
MKFLTATFILISLVSAFGEDSLVNGGKSPDGRYEVRIYQTNTRDPSNYYYGILDTKTGKLIKQLPEGGGYSLYKGAATTAFVLWHSSSHFFALTDHGTRHSMEMYLYEITPDDVILIHQPDYYQNALGRVDATEGYATSVVKPLKWDKDVLTCSLIFDAEIPGHGRSPFYKTQFTLDLLHGPNSSSYLMFTSMGKPTIEE